MNDLIKRQEVIEAFTEMDRMGLSERDIIHEFETMPSVDAVPVIRCKDCIWKYGTDCTRFAEVRVSPEDYCSRGEAKTKRGKHEKEQS